MRTFLKTLVAVGAVLALAGSASAGVIVGAPAGYTPGDVITITVSGDSEGLTAGIARLVLTAPVSVAQTSGVPGVLGTTAGFGQWAQSGTAGTCGTGTLNPNECVALDAFESLTLGALPIDLTPSTFTTFQFDTTGATGDLVFSVAPDGAGFFGLPGTGSATVTVVPEPTTAALLGLGLLGLSAAGRRR